MSSTTIYAPIGRPYNTGRKYRCETCCAYSPGCSYSGDPPDCYREEEREFLEQQGVIPDLAGEDTDCPLWETDCVKIFGPPPDEYEL